jgi:3-oxoacyl-(acyl-carrier-protein) synthase
MEERGKLLFMAACHAAEAWGGFQGHEADGGIAVEVEGARGQEAVPFRDLEPFWLLHQLPNLPAAHLAIESGWRGPCQTFALGRESSLASGPAGGQARRWLERGEARCVIVGRVASGRADVEIWERV